MVGMGADMFCIGWRRDDRFRMWSSTIAPLVVESCEVRTSKPIASITYVGTDTITATKTLESATAHAAEMSVLLISEVDVVAITDREAMTPFINPQRLRNTGTGSTTK
ncbi:MAG: hypothetical protein C0478_13415 [Planctomyces sp.]|nr:hypothetical protein [Planctomyces sp.]